MIPKNSIVINEIEYTFTWGILREFRSWSIWWWVYACTKVNPNEFLCLILDFMLLFHSFYYFDSLLWAFIFPIFFSILFSLFAHLFATRHFTFASALRVCARTDISVRAAYLASICFRTLRLVCFRDSHVFAFVIPTCLHLLDTGLSNTFPRIVGRVETRAAYDLIRKSWPGARYMRGELCNTLSLSSVLDHHWGGELWSISSIVFLLIIL